MIASKPFKCPIIAPNMGEIPSGVQIGAAERISLYVGPSRMPLALILHQQLWEPKVYCLLTFWKRLGPVSYFFLQFAYRLL